MKYIIITIIAIFANFSLAHSTEKNKNEKKRVHTIGDSTMADYTENTTWTRGWGEILQEFFSEEAEVMNYARGGRSSRSFWQEGRWQMVKNNLQPGDYVLIQFAHNDEKEGGKDGDDGRGTAPWTTYKSYLERYVDETRQYAATPVFVTPILRRYFTADGTISNKGCHDLGIAPDDSTLNYVRVMKHVARNKKVQVVDLTALSKKYAEEQGAEKTIKCLYVPTDGTHTQATGAACFAHLAVEDMKRQNILSEYINKETPLVLNPTTLNYKTIYTGDNAVICFDLVGIALTPQNGTLTLEAPEGMTIADAPHNAPKEKLSYKYTDGKLWNKCFYLHFTPKKEGNVNTNVTIKYGNSTRLLPVYADVKSVKERQPVTYTPASFSVRSLAKEDGKVNIEGGKWTAEIDEAQNRYIEFIIPASEQTRHINKLTLTLDGEIAYRIAWAYGKDFYPRTDIGEEQTPKAGVREIVCPMNVILNPQQQLHIRLFPWSTKETDKLSFRITNCKIEGTEYK